MSSFLIVLAVFCIVIVALAHSLLGEVRLIRPLISGNAVTLMEKPLPRTVVHFAWHLTSVAWIAQALCLAALLVFPPDRLPELFAGITAASFLVGALTSLIASRGRHVGWPFLLASALSCFAAAFALG